jgi:hypothetical protein
MSLLVLPTPVKRRGIGASFPKIFDSPQSEHSPNQDKTRYIEQ